MVTLDSDIRELIEKSRTDLTYLSFDILRSTDELPAIRVRQDNNLDNQTSITHTVTMQMFLQWPAGCSTFKEAITASHEEAQVGISIMRELIFGGLVLHKEYKRLTPLSTIVFNGQSVTEHKTIGLQTTVTLEKKYKYECCDEGLYFDFTSYLNPSIWG